MGKSDFGLEGNCIGDRAVTTSKIKSIEKFTGLSFMTFCTVVIAVILILLMFTLVITGNL